MNNIKVVLIIFFAAMGGMIYGYDFGIINGALLFIKEDIPMNSSQLSLLGGAVFFGSAFAILIAGMVADILGRKKAIIFTSVLFIFSLLLVGFIDSYIEILFSRLLQGVAVGLISVVVPLYLSETMSKSVRGRALTAFQLFLTFGILSANYVGVYYASESDWRAMFLLGIIPGLVIFFGAFVLVESPVWLAKRNGVAEANKVYAQLNLENDQGLGDDSKFKKKYSKHLIIVAMIVIFFQLTGINSILEYSSLIFKNTGAGSNQLAVLSSSIMSTCLFGGSIVAFFIADRLERKVVIYLTNIAMTLVLVMIGVLFLLVPDSQIKAYILLGLLILYILSFAVGIGSYNWVIIPELIPTNIRSFGLPLMLFLNSIISFATTSIFLPVIDVIGYANIFFLCSFFTFGFSYFIYRFMPRTTGKSLQEIENAITTGKY
ncbi:MFS transporter [Francisella adeliensis]|uniref:Sugar porter family MFS transporter n=1 Tax=Francisella adeliensis TaxID=2007306 RepID=A0A2Z4Y0P5_9GAMM|nr:MFS transporter [Francisella adeliensis]AXA34448.1 hypothetical protein CDH04_08585 [Francisella adeliensis]MBK2086557.1 MFS transporter [Francisella adeliensis]MBK2096384.1 MFS transporter [Francisella adeliensis]QIW12695.1 sugar porter family MFS transporter [Francisella adeliensis]QIW14571.1 sugar porter family MFS transporter [Francisella adeliensis]